MAATTITLKLLIDKKANKVLFAETGKDFVDFLFHLLPLPIGAVIGFLPKQSMVGCIGNLYHSIENLDASYLQVKDKNSFLKFHKPAPLANAPRLLPNTGEGANPPAATNEKLYNCVNNHRSVSRQYGSSCPQCLNQMIYQVNLVPVENQGAQPASGDGGGYVKGLVTYMVMDDLTVTPISMISGIAMMNKFNVRDFDALEEKVVEFGVEEGVLLLKASFESKAVLTRVFLGTKGAVKTQQCDFS